MTVFIPVCADGARRHGFYPSQREADHARAFKIVCPFGPHRVVREVRVDRELLRRRARVVA